MPRTAPGPMAPPPDVDPELHVLAELRDLAAAVTDAEREYLEAAERAKEKRKTLEAAQDAEHRFVLRITGSEPMPLFETPPNGHAVMPGRDPEPEPEPEPAESATSWRGISVFSVDLIDMADAIHLDDLGIETIGQLADQLTLTTTLGLRQKLVKKLLAHIAALRAQAGEPAPEPVQGTLGTWRDTTIGMVTELTMGEAQRLRNLGILHLGDLADKLEGGDHLGLAAKTVKRLQARIAKDKSEEAGT